MGDVNGGSDLGGNLDSVGLAEGADGDGDEKRSGGSGADRGDSGGPTGGSGREGRLLNGRYRLQTVLGRGGMGTVWRACDEVLGRTVAVKELRFPSGVDEEEKRRLITRTLREAKVIARIRSGGAVTVYDVVDEDDRPWIVMELVEGRSLAEVIREDGPLEPRRAAEVALAVLDVLRAAHQQGILHRDVKPSNVLIAEEDGRVVLTDFGIAKVEGDPSITSTGMLVGAPSYISPERARGRPPGPPSDLWSLGALLYAAVEGRPPYDKGSAIATLTAVMTEPFQPPTRAGALDEVIRGLLTKDPEQRLDNSGARTLLHTAIRTAEESSASESAAGRTAVLPAGSGDPESAPAAGHAADAGSGTAPAADAAAESSPSPARTSDRASGSGRFDSAAPAPSRPAGPTGPASATAARGSHPDGSGGADDGAEHGAEHGAERAAADGGERARGAAAARWGPLVQAVPRRVLVAGAAVVTVLAVLGTVLAFVLNGDGESARGDNGRDDVPAVSKDNPGGEGAADGDADAATEGDGDGSGRDADGKDSGVQGDQEDGGTEGSGQDSNSAESSQGQGTSDQSDPDASGQQPGGAPAGYQEIVDNRFRFRMALPSGWQRTGIAGAGSGGIFSAPGGGLPKVQVDFTGSPRESALDAWRELEPSVRQNSSDYRRIGMSEVEWRGYPTVADWTFERLEDGQRVRVRNRGFRVDDSHGYAIMITCRAEKWDGPECTTLRNTAYQTFAPVD